MTTALRPVQATKVADIELTESAYAADFMVTDKYQAYSAELLRLSLLGLTAYGFLVTMPMKDQITQPSIHAAVESQSVAFSVGLVAISLSAALALAHRFFSTGCLTKQLRILRLLKRLDAPQWSVEERAAMTAELSATRRSQENTLGWCRRVISGSATALGVGVVATAWAFLSVF